MKRNHGIDLFRLIGAFFVVTLHSNFGSMPAEGYENIRLIGRWVVPFYFIISGYFLQKSFDRSPNEAFSKTMKKLIGIVLISNLLYIPVQLARKFVFHLSFDIDYSWLLSGLYFHLWFLNAMIFGYLIIWFFLSINRKNLLFVLSIVLLLLGIFADSYDNFFSLSVNFDLPSFLLSIPYIYCGFIISRHENALKKIIIPSVLLIFIGIIIQYGEARMFLKLFNYSMFNHQLLFGTLILTAGIFVFALNLKIGENKLSLWGQKYALLIYIYHPVIIMIQGAILYKLLPERLFNIVGWFNPLIAFSITLLIIGGIDKYWSGLFNVLNGNLTRK